MLSEVEEALAAVGQEFPELKGKEPEWAGFVWFQGWNDMFNKDALSEYEGNLVHLINDLRKHLKAPNLPVVVGELGNMGEDAGDNMKTIREAQRKACERDEWKGTVRFVKTTQFARPKEESPNVGHGHHWFGNAESYFLIGDALGAAMVNLLSSPGKLSSNASNLHTYLNRHCVQCHGKDGKVKGKVNLLELQTTGDWKKHPELLEDLIGVLEDEEMPPEKEPEMPAKVREALIAEFQALLEETLQTVDYPQTPIRRMNRFQYNNAVVDLLELDRDIFQLNERLLRRYDDYFRPSTRKMPDHVKVASRPLSKDIDGRRPEGFRKVAPFPQDQRAEHGYDNRGDHLTLSPLLMESFLQLSQSIVESPDLNPRECRSWNRLFAEPGKPVAVAGGKFDAENKKWLRVINNAGARDWVQKMTNWGRHWSGDHQLIWMSRKADLELKLEFETEVKGEGLIIAFDKARDYGTFEVFLDGQKLGCSYDLYDPNVIRAKDVQIELPIEPGKHQLTIRCVGKNPKSSSFLFGMDVFEVIQPKQEAPKVTIPKTKEEALQLRIAKLLRRAFRRPPEPETLQRFVDFARKQLSSGVRFEDTMRTVVGAALATPDFLYLYETRGDAGQGFQLVDDFELASRLAMFFWGSIPDDSLLELAEAGTLKEAKVLSAQIDRMLNDPRSSRFCDGFSAQWLQLDRLVTSVPDPKQFPYFYYSGYRVSMHMMLEPLLLFETVYVEDRSVLELLAPDFTWQSSLLAGLYQGKRNGGEDKVLNFKRVSLEDPRLGGVITNAAVMTMTSSPERTQPINRGAWVNAVIFNDPPEPPPADVPPLPPVDEEKLAKLTIRERLSEHRKREDCAGCHNKIDPLGFALENFGPTGIWRDKYENGLPVDMSGELYRNKFNTIEEFKQLLLKEKQRFLRGFVSHLFSYALGRELSPADSPAIDAITKKAMIGEDQMRTILKNISMSDPFLHKNPK